MFVESTDFLALPYKIPNQEETREFVDFIETESENILKKLLGIELFNELVEALATSGDLEERWEAFQDGTDYTYGDVLYHYNGIVDLLKPEIYSKWVKLNYRKLTTSGIVINQGQQNTTTNNPDVEFAQAHNDYVSKVGSSCKQKNTLYGFMTANESDYDGWEFEEQELTNQFNL